MFNEWGIPGSGYKPSLPFQGMLGTTGGRFMGPSGSSQLQLHRNPLWPPLTAAAAGRSLEFQTNGEVTESLFAAGGYTPPVSSAFMPVTPLELVAKNFHSGTVAFSQANSSIFVQSQTDFLNGTTAVAKKTETCFGRWGHGGVVEPLQINVPPLSTTVHNLTIKTENTHRHNHHHHHHHHTQSSSSLHTGHPHPQLLQQQPQSQPPPHLLPHKELSLIAASTGTPLTPTLSNSLATTVATSGDLATGCSRTIPISWTTLQQHHTSLSNTNGTSESTSAACTLLQIKREPCQVSEVTTSNNIGPTNTSTSLTAVVKIEAQSPKIPSLTHNSQHHQIHNMDTNNLSGGQQQQHSNGPSIPVGIAVARQRLQETTTTTQHQFHNKDINRFGIGCATPNLNQNMFFTGGTNSTMIPLSSDGVTMGVSNVRTPPTLWQYPAPMPVEQMLPMPPPVGFQLVRDPTTGQILIVPTTTSIEPSFQQAVVWPTYHQQAPSTASLQQPLLLPPMQPQLQPPPLAPLQLLGSDYLTASTTLHQHTQTHSTRLVALTSDTKRKTNSAATTVPLPIPSHTFIKIEDCAGSTTHGGPSTSGHHQSSSTIFEHEKSIQTASATIHTNEMPQNMTAQFLYQHPGNLIHISGPAPHHHPSQSLTPASIMEATIHDYRTSATSPGLQPPPLIPTLIATNAAQLTPPPERCDSMEIEPTPATSMPDVQDANIQTDTPIMSEDDNTTGTEGVASVDAHNEESNEPTNAITQTTNYEQMCHNTDSNNANSESAPELTVLRNVECVENNTSSVETDHNNPCEAEVQVPSAVPVDGLKAKMELASPVKYVPQMMDASPPEHMVQIQTSFRPPPPQEQPVDLSGLELLSNSIEVFQKKSIVKKEPMDLRENAELHIPPLVAIEPERQRAGCESPAPKQNIELVPSSTISHQIEGSYVGNDEPMGGLNLLCALAEQRFQEEVDQRNKTVSNPESTPSSDEFESKKQKHKHSSSKKSSKKSRHDRDKVDGEKESATKKRKLSSDKNVIETETEEDLSREVQHSLMRVKAKFDKKCNCKEDIHSAPGAHHCCSSTNWPTSSELISEMESDMKEHLANIMRQCQEKKRELDEISPLLKNIKQQAKHSTLSETTVKPIFFGGQTSQKLSLIPALSPSFSSSSNSESTLVELPKLSSDTDSSKFEDVETSSVERLSTSKRKGGIPKRHDDTALTETIVAKKPKSLVGYILASKNKIADSNVKELVYSKGSTEERICKKSKLPTSSKSESFSFSTADETSCLSDSSFRTNTNKTLSRPEVMQSSSLQADDDDSSKPLSSFAIFGEKPFRFEMTKHETKASKHHSKHKKSRSNKDGKHRRLSEKKRIDNKCVLTAEILEKDKIRVLTSMGGLFYAGCLSALQPPDVYAVTLDGERGNRPHIMSREEILRDAILEVAPTNAADVTPGTRLCAYWSQQYRCLYPGVAAEPGTPDPDGKFVNVEFDDGDNGKIAIEDIRFLLSDYPIVEYDPNPLLSLNKRKRRSSQRSNTETETSAVVSAAPSTSSTNAFSHQKSTTKRSSSSTDDIDRDERRRLKKIRKEQMKLSSSTEVNFAESGVERKHKKKHKCNDENCKHRKHKKRRKHKKHHRMQDEEDNSTNSPSTENISPEDEISPDESASQTANFDLVEKVDEVTGKTSLKDDVFNPNLKEDTMTEEEIASAVTESSGSYYEPKKVSTERNKSAENCSKIAAFLPARQLWAWSGKGFRRSSGRVKKQFFRTIQRGKETITVGDSAVFLSTGRPDRPYIGHIESMWETNASNMVVRVKWFYHPEETQGCPPNLKYPGALFESPHEDENDVQTISHKCEVLPIANYTKKFGSDPKMYQSIYDNNDTYYLAGYYDPTSHNIKMQPNIDLTEEN